ncbi:MAG: LAGLIDADG family homing endonuclease [Candidatus Woesearchaeota archaeon]
MVIFNERLAEFVGIMLGDGYISYPKTPRIKISLDSIVDKDYLSYVHTLLEEIFGCNIILENRKTENTSNLFIFNRDVIRSIINEIGLIPSPKWDRAIIPTWIFQKHFEKQVLRGYFDTDGCVVRTNNNGTLYPRLEMKISPSPMQKQFIKILSDLGFRFKAYNIGKGKVRIQINGKEELRKWCSLVGFSNAKHASKANFFLNTQQL